MMKKWTFLVVMLLLCILDVPAAAAQYTTHVRFGHFVFNGPQVNIFVDKDIYNDEAKAPYGLNATELSRTYMELSSGIEHTFTVVEAGQAIDVPLFEPQKFTLEAAHNYTLAIMGNVKAKDLHLVLMDETAAIKANDPKVSAISFVFNNLYGVPGVDLYFAGQLLLENLAYGDYVVAQDATEGVGSKFTVHNDPKTVLFQLGDAIPGPAQTIAFFGIAGSYPGTLWEDYTIPYAGNYIGEPIVKEGGAIKVGDVIKVNLTEAGVRYDYKLVLDKDMTLDIGLKGAGTDSGSDSYLRIFDAQGQMIAQNDDLDRQKLGTDAGLLDFKLPSGIYVIEAATPFDTFLGDYTLSVIASK